MSITIKQILDLLGNDLRDESSGQTRYREFIEAEQWEAKQLKLWLDECKSVSSEEHDSAYPRALQDLIVSLGKKLGFEVEYGRYQGRRGQGNPDGVWRRGDRDVIVVEVKKSTWPIGTVNQLGGYMDELAQHADRPNVYGLYVIGQGDVQALREQIQGGAYKDRMRLIQLDDLVRLLEFKDELEPAFGESGTIEKIQKVLLPIESINVGNIVSLMIELAATRSATAEERTGEEDTDEPSTESVSEGEWSAVELESYLAGTTPYQRVLLAGLVVADESPCPKRRLLQLMNEIKRRKPDEGIEKEIRGYEIAGARAGLAMRRKQVGREDILSHSQGKYSIKERYKQMVEHWVRSQDLWLDDLISR